MMVPSSFLNLGESQGSESPNARVDSSSDDGYHSHFSLL